MKKLITITLIVLFSVGICSSWCLAAPKEEKNIPPGQAKERPGRGAEQRLLAQERKAQNALNKLDRSSWWYNPNDTSGQGNMGNVVMIAPYGHDKDSDRLALYGNRGRVITVDPTPEDPDPTPDPDPEDPEPPLPPDYPPF